MAKAIIHIIEITGIHFILLRKFNQFVLLNQPHKSFFLHTLSLCLVICQLIVNRRQVSDRTFRKYFDLIYSNGKAQLSNRCKGLGPSTNRVICTPKPH